jgi:arabinose-5-phosphate isomerase
MKLVGIITDGDLRRLLSQGVKALKRKAAQIMTANPSTASAESLAVDALYLMEKKKITALPVVTKITLRSEFSICTISFRQAW